MMKLTLAQGYLTSHNTCLLLGPAPTGKGTIASDPTFGSFTLLEPVSFTLGEKTSLVRICKNSPN